jgi:hypothetical protein
MKLERTPGTRRQEVEAAEYLRSKRTFKRCTHVMDIVRRRLLGFRDLFHARAFQPCPMLSRTPTRRWGGLLFSFSATWGSTS